MKLKNKYSNKIYIAIKNLWTKFDIINKYYDISKFFTISGKYFPPKFSRKTLFWKSNQILF